MQEIAQGYLEIVVIRCVQVLTRDGKLECSRAVIGVHEAVEIGIGVLHIGGTAVNGDGNTKPRPTTASPG